MRNQKRRSNALARRSRPRLPSPSEPFDPVVTQEGSASDSKRLTASDERDDPPALYAADEA